MSGPLRATDAVTSRDELIATSRRPAGMAADARWFGGKDREITAVRPLSWTTLLDGDPLLIHLVRRGRAGSTAASPTSC